MHSVAYFLIQLAQTGNLYGMIVDIIKTLPCATCHGCRIIYNDCLLCDKL